MARLFLGAEYGVIIDDIVTPDALGVYRAALAGCGHEVHFVVLRPPLTVLLERERVRPTEWHRAARLEEVYERFAAWTDVAVIEPGDMAPDLVADRVMALAGEGRALLFDQNAK
jgi:hypothetical protein